MIKTKCFLFRTIRIPLIKQFRQNTTFHLHLFVYHGIDPFQSRPNIYIHRVLSKFLVPQQSFLNLLQEKLSSSGLTGSSDDERVRRKKKQNESLVNWKFNDDRFRKMSHRKTHRMFLWLTFFKNSFFTASIKILNLIEKKFLKKLFIYSRTNFIRFFSFFFPFQFHFVTFSLFSQTTYGPLIAPDELTSRLRDFYVNISSIFTSRRTFSSFFSSIQIFSRWIKRAIFSNFNGFTRRFRSVECVCGWISNVHLNRHDNSVFLIKKSMKSKEFLLITICRFWLWLLSLPLFM